MGLALATTVDTRTVQIATIAHAHGGREDVPGSKGEEMVPAETRVEDKEALGERGVNRGYIYVWKRRRNWEKAIRKEMSRWSRSGEESHKSAGEGAAGPNNARDPSRRNRLLFAASSILLHLSPPLARMSLELL